MTLAQNDSEDHPQVHGTTGAITSTSTSLSHARAVSTTSDEDGSCSSLSSDEVRRTKTLESGKTKEERVAAPSDSAEPQGHSASDPDLQRIPTIRSLGRVEIVDEKPVFKPTWQLHAAFLALCLLSLTIAFDATTLSVALPTISTDLGGTALEAFWSGTSFLLASTVLQPTVAALSHIFGRKLLIYICSAIFFAGSLIGALANDFTILLVGRTIQGIGGGGILTLTEIVVTDLVPLQFRGEWMARLSGAWAVGTVTGPLIGAGFSENITWRWIFYINLPITAIGVVAIHFFLHQNEIPGGTMQKLGRFDWVGSMLFIASSTVFLFGITAGGTMYAWNSAAVLVSLIGGVLLMVGFGWWVVRFAKEPIVNKGVLNNWDMIASYIMTVFHGVVLWSVLYFLTLYYQAIKQYSPVISAVAALPETLSVAPAAGFVGFLVTRTGRYRWSLWSGWFLTTLGAGLLVLLKPETTVAQWIFLNLPIGLGTGILFPAMALSIQAACEPAMNGEAAAFFSFLRTFGQAVGVAVSGVIFQNVFKSKLQDSSEWAPVADEYSRDATSVVAVIKAMAPGPGKTDLVESYNGALTAIWISMIAFAGFCLLLSATVKGYSLEQEHVTKQAFEHGEKDEDVERSSGLVQA